MNSSQSINTRLLRLLPVSFIKEFFNSEKRTQIELINDIIERYQHNEIYNFVNDNINITKQNVYIYQTKNVYKHRSLIESEHLGLEIHKQLSELGDLQLDGYHDVYVDIKILKEEKEFDEIQIKVKQPYQVRTIGKYLIIKLTKIESNLKSHFGSDIEVLKSKKITDDGELIHKVLTYFDMYHNVRPSKADLNKGVKHLWENGNLDCREVAYRKDASRAREVMDENSLYKEIYPDDYMELMRKPLESCSFRYLLDDQEFPEHFICDATNGTFSFNIFPKNPNQINAIINEIIRGN